MEKKYGAGFANYTPEEQARIAVGRQIAEEGMVLLENNGLLPLKKGTKTALIGAGQIAFLHGGSGSGSTVADYVVKLPEAMVNAGAVIDELLTAQYLAHYEKEQAKLEEIPVFARRGVIPEMPLSHMELQACAQRSDVAVVVFSRLAGEGRDRQALPGDYYLSNEEHALLSAVKAYFSHYVVLLNICGIIDMNWVEQYQPDAVLITWVSGQEGASAAADILMGNVNPSGHLSDTIPYAWRDIPSSENFGAWADGFELYTGTEDQINYWGGVGNHDMVPVGETVVRPIGNRRYTEYQEGLYVGYRYFTTFGVPVRYPFGYGLSYTTFARTASGFVQEDDSIAFHVTVKNTGTVAGKDVVQIYLHGAEAALERPERELIAFEKTALLEPGAEQTLHFHITNRELAVYSEEKAAWVLQDGVNTLYCGGNAVEHTAFATFRTTNTILEQVENRVCLNHSRPLNQLSKKDPVGTKPKAPPIPAPGEEKHSYEKPDNYQWPEVDHTEGRWKLKDVRDGRVSMEEFLSQLSDFELLVLVIGANAAGNSAIEAEYKELQKEVPPDLSTKATQLGPLFECIPGMSGYTATIDRVGIPNITLSDGPAGIRSGKLHNLAFPSATTQACTFSKALAYAFGDAIGAEAVERHCDVWLGPSMNIHRNPLAGRNYEYYSEDPVLSGKLATEVVRGAQSHQISVCVKHFAANNQETARWDRDSSVIAERVLREIYLRGFEMVVREGGAKSIMTSYNPINGIQTACNQELLDGILRKEWGFRGFVVTDWEGDTGLAMECLEAGNDLLMPGFPGMTDYLYKKLLDGSLKRETVAACAERILRFVMESATMDRYLAAK